LSWGGVGASEEHPDAAAKETMTSNKKHFFKTQILVLKILTVCCQTMASILTAVSASWQQFFCDQVVHVRFRQTYRQRSMRRRQLAMSFLDLSMIRTDKLQLSRSTQSLTRILPA